MTSDSPTPPRPEGEREHLTGRPALAGLGIVLLVQVLVTVRLGHLPAALGPDAPAEAFSATRARDVLERILGDEAPHPLGSEENARVVKRLLAELERVGLEPQVQHSFTCSPGGSCGPVRNVVAVLPGADAGPAVMLAAHHDSVPAGPGASDDGAAVATIVEIARALQATGTPRRSVVFLITDAEEAGLLGARAFVRDHPLAGTIGTVVNLEARGTTGPSAMFETSSGNAGLVRTLAGSLPRPVTSSVLYSLYRQLPNDTDLTVFKAHGLQGVNFAFADGVERYHTPLDDLAHLDERTVQHQGAAALAVVRALANAEDEPRRDRDAVFFDVLAFGIAWWPASWSLPLTLVALILVVTCTDALRRAGLLRLRELGRGLACWPVLLLAPVPAGLAFTWTLQQLTRTEAPWAAHRAPAVVGLWILALGIGLACAAWLKTLTNTAALWSASAAWRAVFAVIACFTWVEATYLFLIPTLVEGLLMAAWVLSGRTADPRRLAIPMLASLALSAAPWLELSKALMIMTGPGASPGVTIPVAVLVATMAPLVPWPGRLIRPLAIGWLIACVACLVVAATTPSSTRDRPAGLNVGYHLNAHEGEALWLLGPRSGGVMPEPLLAAAPFEVRSIQLVPWQRERRMTVADAPVLDLLSPTLTLEEELPHEEGRVMRLRFHSRRGADSGSVMFRADAGIIGLRVQGEQVPLDRTRFGWRGCFVRGLPRGGVVIDLLVRHDRSITVLLADRTPGLPDRGAAILTARPADRVPYQIGDSTVVVTRATL